jgi:transposase
MAAFWLPLMLTQEQAVEIRVLRRRGLGLRAIARELGCSRTTVKRYLRDEIGLSMLGTESFSASRSAG